MAFIIFNVVFTNDLAVRFPLKKKIVCTFEKFSAVAWRVCDKVSYRKWLKITSLDDLRHIVGTDSTRRGLLTFFDLFQTQEINRRLIFVLLEGKLYFIHFHSIYYLSKMIFKKKNIVAIRGKVHKRLVMLLFALPFKEVRPENDLWSW